MRVLVADNDAVTRLWIESIVQGCGYQTIAVEHGDAAWQLLQQDDAPALVLLEWLMPGIDGIEICRRLKSAANRRASHVIMLSSRSPAEIMAEAVKAGADDVIAKPFEPAEFELRLRLGERVLTLQRDLQAKASHDELTGLLNRSLLMELALRKFENARRGEMPITLMLLDIDLFKQINHHLGHRSGDDVLREVGRRIQDTVRLVDIAGRYGGEEFLIVLPKCNLASATDIAQRLRAAIAMPIVADGRELKITASVGIAALTQETLDLSDWIARAGRALHRAKENSRDCIESAPEA